MTAFLAHAAAAGARTYAMASEVFTISIMLWALNALATLTEKTYTAGVAVGKFYKNNCHSLVVAGAKRGVAAMILVSDISWDATKRVYKNRDEILSNINDYRNAVGRAFVYTSPVVA